MAVRGEFSLPLTVAAAPPRRVVRTASHGAPHMQVPDVLRALAGGTSAQKITACDTSESMIP